MPVHPQYEAPMFRSGVLGLHGIHGPYILCVGAIEPRKNLRRLVNAFERVRSDGAATRLRLVLAGPSAWDEDFRRWLVSSDAYPQTQMLGFVPLDHLPSLYHYASAVIMPSVYEGFGIPVLEAMCCSSVVLASNNSSLAEVLGDAGMSFDPYDTREIGNAILRALQLCPAEAEDWRRRGRERAEAHIARIAREPSL
jgi:glycosyltransferase involved in cell wall biosynthesis